MIIAISGNLPDTLKLVWKKKHVPKCVEIYIKDKLKTMNIEVKNAIRRSAIAGHLIKNLNCAELYEEYRFKVLRQCSKFSELIKFEVILIHLNKSKICKNK